MNNIVVGGGSFYRNIGFVSLIGLIFGVLMNVGFSLPSALFEFKLTGQTLSPFLIQGLIIFLLWLIFIVLCAVILDLPLYTLGEKLLAIFAPSLFYVIAWGLVPLAMFMWGGDSAKWDDALAKRMAIVLPSVLFFTSLAILVAGLARENLLMLINKVVVPWLPEPVRRYLEAIIGETEEK